MGDEQYFSWLEANDRQINWLVKYIDRRKQFYLSGIDDFYTLSAKDKRALLSRSIKSALSGDSLELFMKKAKAAWKQYERRNIKPSRFVSRSMEVDKRVYDDVLTIAKKYRIPANVAINELLRKSVDLEKSIGNAERTSALSAKKAISSRKNRMKLLGLDEKQQSLEHIKSKLQQEMYERHLLELDIIESVCGVDSGTEKSTLLSQEKDRYKADCVEYKIAPLNC